MSDLISRQAAIDAFAIGKELLKSALDQMYVVGNAREKYEFGIGLIESYIADMKELPSAQSETSRIENALHGKSAEEQYDFIRWLMFDYGMWCTDSREAVIEWLKGEGNAEIH